MAHNLYKGHILVTTASYSYDTGSWVSSVSVSWREGASFNFHKFDGSPSLFRTGEDAISHGFQLGRLWVDKKLAG